MTTLFFSLYSISSAVVNDVCCGNSKHVFNSLKSKHILYSCEKFCSPVSFAALVVSLNSSLPVGLGTKTTLLLHSLSDSLTTPDCCNWRIACNAN